MKQRCIYYLVTLLFLFACNLQEDRDTDEVHNECISNYELLKGNWQSHDFWNSYTEIQLTDSLRCYVNHGAYIGPTIAEEYSIKNDTLFRIETGQKYQICIKDSFSILLIDHIGHRYEWKRFNPTHKISDWSLGKDSIFDAQFLIREKEYGK